MMINRKIKFTEIIVFAMILTMSFSCSYEQKKTEKYEGVWEIKQTDDGFSITAGILARTIKYEDRNIITSSISTNGKELLQKPSKELSLTFTKAYPNVRPKGIKKGEFPPFEIDNGVDDIEIINQSTKYQTTKWKDSLKLSADNWNQIFNYSSHRITKPSQNITQLNIRFRAVDKEELNDVFIDVFYEIYNHYPVIRKWVKVTNNGMSWLKIEDLITEVIQLGKAYCNKTELTPSAEGSASGVVSFGDVDNSNGIIAVSEVPAVLRKIYDTGAMGYSKKYFERVIGPAENFVSEPVFIYAYSGKKEETISGISTALDRAVEMEYKKFLDQYILTKTSKKEIISPVWCIWTNYAYNINDKIVRETVDIAAEIGIECYEIDAGWTKADDMVSWACAGSEPHKTKFPDFDATCDYINSKGLNIGLWVSDYRRKDAKDFKALPDAESLPGVKRQDGVAMSLCSDWKDYFANDILYLVDRYKVKYIKQDLSNTQFGDIAEGHESRTYKESYLRGVRGLFEVYDKVRESAPEVTLEMTHEIYWGTPGVPCDIAALKHVNTYHIPYNDYSGAGHKRQVYDDTWEFSPEELREDLIDGCFNARKGFYNHRGLPLRAIEYYAATTFNYKGSLTPQVQDRQICSWLMGVPSVFAGQLTTLTAQNRDVYKRRFAMLKRLQKTYDIYNYFQYSGVPKPTDTDWHWWGKLNEEGCGIVVVVRGSKGSDKRMINIPWVDADKKYMVKSLLNDKQIGTYSGKQLQDGEVNLTLPVNGQEILEISCR